MQIDLTELERVKLENFALRILFMQQQIQQMNNERQNFIQQLEAKHPGYEWSDAHGTLLRTEVEEVDDEAAYAIDSAKGR